MHIVVIGNPMDGLSFVGPFADQFEAVNFAEGDRDNNWWVAKIDEPPSGMTDTAYTDFDQVEHGLEEGIAYLNRLIAMNEVHGIMATDAESARDNLVNALSEHRGR